MRLLIAEDDEIIQLLMQVYCSRLGLYCQLVTNGEEAIDALRLNAFDLVILDCQMPVLDGWQAVRLIRSQGLIPEHMKVVAFTAATRPEDRQLCLDAGFDDFIPKPIKLNDFQDVVFRITGRPPEPSSVYT